MLLWRSGQRKADSGASLLPQPGEAVRVTAGEEGRERVYAACVRALGLRRIFLDIVGAPSLSGQHLTLSFVRGDALYKFASRSIGPFRPNALTITRPAQVTRLQRRQFYRLSLESPTTFRIDAHGALSDPIPARLVNLSGGGALLTTAKPVPSGASVSVRIPVGKDGQVLPVESEVLDCRVATQGQSRVYLLRLRFFGPPRLADTDRDEIVAYIYEQQRLLLSTRKLFRA